MDALKGYYEQHSDWYDVTPTLLMRVEDFDGGNQSIIPTPPPGRNKIIDLDHLRHEQRDDGLGSEEQAQQVVCGL